MNTEYKNHIEKQLFDIEQSFLPATQIEVEKDIEIEKINKEISKRHKQIRDIKSEIFELHLQLHRVSTSNKLKDVEKKQFIQKCPSQDCRGYLSTQWKCGICEVRVCKDCHEIKTDDETHECNPDVVETIKMLKKDSKNCPKCSSIIYKINGCDQMFCTQCHTAFNWSTLKIVTNNIHKPHYFEWLRNESTDGNIPRNPDDGYYCPNRLESPIRITSLLKNLSLNTKILDRFWKTYRTVQHMASVELDRYPVSGAIDMNSNMDLRKKYIRCEITKEAFQRQLQIRDKKRRKMNDFNQVWSMFVNVSTEHINSMLSINITTESIIEICNIIESLCGYCNNASKLIGNRYNCVYPTVSMDGTLVSIKKS